MNFKAQLRIPGPTPVPARVVTSASRPMINHRSAEFAAVMEDCLDGLKWALRTDADVLLYPASGTGGLEAVVANLLSPGETALFVSVGWFGDMWADIGDAFGASVVRLTVPWGKAADPEHVDEMLRAKPEVTKVFVTHNETSTGVTNDLTAIAKVVKRHRCLLAVDSISGAGCLPLAVDDLGLDVVVTSSQKGWMAPPGLAMIALSTAALAACVDAKCPRWYFDFLKQRNCHLELQTHMTPPVSVMYALQEALSMMREEGRAQVWQRHRQVADIVRAGVSSLGLRMYAAPGHRSDTVTAVCSPLESSKDLASFLQHLHASYGLTLAGGHGPLHGRIFRIGHLGMITSDDAVDTINRLRQGLADFESLTARPQIDISDLPVVPDHRGRQVA